MPSSLVRRGDRVGARAVIAGREVWCGTHDTAEEARAAIEASRSEASRARRSSRRQARRQIRVPTLEEVDAIVAAARDDTFRGFVLCGAWSGLRLFELAALDWRDVERGEPEKLAGVARLQVRKGKGGRARTSILYRPGLVALDGLRPSLMTDPLAGTIFLNRARAPFSRQRVNVLWRAACEAVEVEPMNFHALRHFHATWLLDQGVSDLDTAVQLGHFDARGFPNADLIRKTYGHPSARAALDRLAVVR